MDAKRQWQKRIEEQRASGLSIAAWCAQKQLAKNRFYYWRERLSKEGGSQSGAQFVRIGTSDPVEIVVNGACIRVGQGFDQETLRKVVELLRA